MLLGPGAVAHGRGLPFDAQTLLAQGVGQAAGDRYGYSVAISGAFAAIGAPGDGAAGFNAGAVYLFERDDSGKWRQVDKLLPSGPAIGGQRRTYGGAVALDGATLVVGPSIRPNTRLVGARAVDVFERDASGLWTRVATLTGDDPNDLTQWGGAVDVSGRRLIVGDSAGYGTGFTGSFVRSGRADIFEKISGTWQHVDTLADGSGGNSFFGKAVAIRGALTISGNYAVVGAPSDERAVVYERNGNGNWVRSEFLEPIGAADDSNAGISVAISGTTVLVGANLDTGAGTRSGAAYVYERISSQNWQQQARLVPLDNAEDDLFGVSVALSGDRAVVGTGANGRLFVWDSGELLEPRPEAAYVFERTQTGAWVEWQKLEATDSEPAADFGGSAAISGEHLLVGARFSALNGDDSGSAQFFARGVDDWDGGGTVVPQDGSQAEQLGLATALDGVRALVAARYERIENGLFRGRAYLFTRESGEPWVNSAVFDPPEDSSVYSRGGYVDLSGPWAVFGVPGDDETAINAGAVYMYRDEGASGWVQAQKLLLQFGGSGDLFGELVAIDGDIAVFSGAGSAWVFEKNPAGVWVEWAELVSSGGSDVTSVAVQGHEIFVGDREADDGGAVYVFRRTEGGAWPEVQRIAAADGVAGDLFGWSVAVDGADLVVGASADNDRGEDAGSAYVFERSGDGTWLPRQKLLSTDGAEVDRFGWEVSLSSGRIAVSTLRGVQTGSGTVCLFARDPSGAWNETDCLEAGRDDGAVLFGVSAAVGPNLLLIGDASNPINGVDAGAAWISEFVIFADGFESGDTTAWSP